MSARGEQREGDRRTILVADDEQDILELMAGTLRDEGHAVVTARTGEEAVALACEHHPQLILLDVAMPQVDGLEITRRLRRHRLLRDSPIILVTARTADADVARGFVAGADDYLKKPFGPGELQARVEAMLRRGRAVPPEEVAATPDDPPDSDESADLTAAAGPARGPGARPRARGHR